MWSDQDYADDWTNGLLKMFTFGGGATTEENTWFGCSADRGQSKRRTRPDLLATDRSDSISSCSSKPARGSVSALSSSSDSRRAVGEEQRAVKNTPGHLSPSTLDQEIASLIKLDKARDDQVKTLKALQADVKQKEELVEQTLRKYERLLTKMSTLTFKQKQVAAGASGEDITEDEKLNLCMLHRQKPKLMKLVHDIREDLNQTRQRYQDAVAHQTKVRQETCHLPTVFKRRGA